MKVSDFYYDLPEELIAQKPLEDRAASRLMVLDKKTGQTAHCVFRDILKYLKKGDCLVLNDTKVIPARLYGRKENQQSRIEFVLIKKHTQTIWEVIVRPGKKVRPGSCIVFGEGKLKAYVREILENGNRIVEFEYVGIFEEVLDEVGLIPLPPYITEKLDDPDRYQTVYAREKGSSAAPTAGLHFTDELLEEIREMGVDIAYVTLHVGLGTFRPVKVANVEDHYMHTEYYEIKEENAKIINDARESGRRIFCVGTTSCRVLESVSDENGFVKADTGETDIFIYPGYKFKIVDALITNFHLPESTLLMLVSSLAGRENILNAYKEAVNKRYRFFSFGDAMLII
jgi:S-adenosylmethionine:tRNA ribosyltransferase-isomerase